jgi:glycosyltransferase involved in cell wall biosynthesis
MPKLSIVTPSLNQVRYLRFALQSVLAWQRSEVEHIVVDGGSTDGSIEVIKAYADHLTHWVSEPDNGQYDAINRGFARSTGDLMAWLNADDMYFPWTIATAVHLFETFDHIEWLTTRHPMVIDADGRLISIGTTYGYDRKSFLAGFNLSGAGWPADAFIQQESTFWRRSLWEKAGGFVDSSLEYAADFDLWARFFEHAQLYSADVPLAAFRRQEGQKTATAFADYISEAKSVLGRYGSTVPDPEVMPWRVRQRTDPTSARALIRAGLADPAPIVVFDWETKGWIIRQV